MSIEIIRKVFEGSRAMVSDRLMLLAIAEHADNSGQCWPSINRLARWCNTTPRNATRLVNNLQAMGELEVKRCAGPKGANLYQIRIETLTPVSPPDKDVTPDTSVTTPPDTQSTPPDTQGSSPLTPVSPEPSLNLQEPSIEPSKKARTRKARATSLPDDFQVSDAVQAWAEQKGFAYLDAHLEHFIGYAKANGKTYIDWDQALMNAIRGNWAKVHGNGQTSIEAGNLAAAGRFLAGKKYAAAAAGIFGAPETPWERRARERMEGFLPNIAAKPPGAKSTRHSGSADLDDQTGTSLDGSLAMEVSDVTPRAVD